MTPRIRHAQRQAIGWDGAGARAVFVQVGTAALDTMLTTMEPCSGVVGRRSYTG